MSTSGPKVLHLQRDHATRAVELDQKGASQRTYSQAPSRTIHPGEKPIPTSLALVRLINRGRTLELACNKDSNDQIRKLI